MTYLHPRPKRRTYKGEKRSKSIGSKVTAEDYDRCVEHAYPRTVSEWNRDLVLRELNGAPAASPLSDRRVLTVLVEELYALRYITVNGLMQLAPPADRVAIEAQLRGLLVAADKRKVERARELLERREGSGQ